MPTNVLYEAAYAKLPGGLSFFGYYNDFAVRGSSRNRRDANKEASESDFLSVPSVWAQDVVDGIKRRFSGKEQQLIGIGEFLFDASFYGFSLESLTKKHLDDVSHRYVSVGELLSSHIKVAALQQQAMQQILTEAYIWSMITIMPTGYGNKVMFVNRDRKNNFLEAFSRYHQGGISTEWNAIADSDAVSGNGARSALKLKTPSGLAYLFVTKDYAFPQTNLTARITALEKQRTLTQSGTTGLVHPDIGAQLMRMIATKTNKLWFYRTFERLLGVYIGMLEESNDDALIVEAREIINAARQEEQERSNLTTRRIARTVNSLEELVGR